MYIHQSLTELMARNDVFGGISVVCFVDFPQLLPVKGNQPFVRVTDMEAKQRLGSVACFDIWKVFSYDELTINMMKNGDTAYAQNLDGHQLLCSRLTANDRWATADEVCDLYCQFAEEGNSPMILMPRTDLCNTINAAMLSRFLCDSFVTVCS